MLNNKNLDTDNNGTKPKISSIVNDFGLTEEDLKVLNNPSSPKDSLKKKDENKVIIHNSTRSSLSEEKQSKLKSQEVIDYIYDNLPKFRNNQISLFETTKKFKDFR